MKKCKFIVALGFLFVPFVSIGAVIDCPKTVSGAADCPKQRPVMIDSTTRNTIHIMPGAGVKLIFPWVLDSTSRELPYSGKIINEGVFGMIRPDGQNFIIVHLKVKGVDLEGEISDMFINVEGYHFALRLVVDFEPSHHYSSIVFKLSDKDKHELIERAISKRNDALQEEYNKKEKELDKRAEMLALKKVGAVAISEYTMGSPSEFSFTDTNVKEEEISQLDNSDEIVFYVDVVKQYQKFIVIPVEVKNDSQSEPLFIQGISLGIKDEGGIGNNNISVVYEAKEKLLSGEVAKGFVVTQDMSFLNKGEKTMTLTTNRGKVDVIWE